MKSIKNPVCVLFIISLVLFSPFIIFAQVERAELGIVGMVCNL